MKLSKSFIYASSFLIIAITLLYISRWSNIKLTDYLHNIGFVTGYLMIAMCCYLAKKSDIPNNKVYLPIRLYLIWMVLEIVRGYLFYSPNYYVKRQLFDGIISSSLPLLAYLAIYPKYTQLLLHYWMKWCLPIFIVIYAWFTVPDGYHFYLAPLFIVGCFLPWIPGMYKYVIAFLIVIMTVIDLGARSQMIKAILALLMSVALIFRKVIPDKALKITHWGLYVLTFVLLFLGLTGRFNIFEDLSGNKDLSRTTVDSYGNVQELGDDTRTALYYEIFESAVDNGYVILGRTPARGHDSNIWGRSNAFSSKTGLFERYDDEMVMTNVFTHFGLIGIILYSLIYIFGSYLAVYRSKSFAMKLVGVLIAFHWLYGWVEDWNAMNINNISLWILIGMGLSQRFREMTDENFKLWIKGIFTGHSLKKVISL